MTQVTSKHSRIALSPLSISCDSLAISKLITPQKTIVVITEDTQSARRLTDEITYFAPLSQTLLFPDWETLPYDHFSPHIDLVSSRLMALWQMRQGYIDALVMPVSTALMRLSPIAYLMGRIFSLEIKQQLNADNLCRDLTASGYCHVSQVVMRGEFAVRGGIIDLYPIAANAPYRIDLFDNEIEALYTFDPDTQKTIEKVNSIHLLPAKEYPTDQKAIEGFCERYQTFFGKNAKENIIYRQVAKGLWPAGIEYYLPLFFENSATIFDYIGSDALFIKHGAIAEKIDHLWRDITNFYEVAQSDLDQPVLPPTQLYLNKNELAGYLKCYTLHTLKITKSIVPDIAISHKNTMPFEKFLTFFNAFDGKTLIVSESLGRRETLIQLLKQHQLFPIIVGSWEKFLRGDQLLYITTAPITESFITNKIAVFTESALYQHVAYLRSRQVGQKPIFHSDNSLRDLAEINVGDKVVHEDHGIGCYQGLKPMQIGDEIAEMMEIIYANDAKLYVPVMQLHLISRYIGQDASCIALHQLGHTSWLHAKRKALEEVRDTAAELLKFYAERMAKQGDTFVFPEKDYPLFVSGFNFEETDDQLNAIQAVIQDMCSKKPMDRLICGDVGFGKTEVALRAAFIAVMNGFQVTILVPTTLLAEQHYQTFCDRFANWPVQIAELSRFRTKSAIHEALLGLKNGTIDIAIGTHRLLQSDVQFKKLGLAVIDEEHRFGVRQKESLKRLRVNVNALTLTATPIPRTLSMALEGLRDFSMITTAPSRRLAIKTFVSPISDGMIREAVLRELKRGGQVFFLYNEVKTIHRMQEKLTQLVPEAHIATLHGQMNERFLEEVMHHFLQQHYNVLLCSTIIETGIDIPNANTIIVYRADRFGLAQLHQLRGRVGRSYHQAYAYLLVPEEMTKDAKKRLEAIQMADELGAGFFLAMQDLEIRGAGAVLGEKQSGDIQAVGFSLYSAMLKRAVAFLKKGLILDLDSPLHSHTDVNLHSHSFLPENYCSDIHERLVLYKRLASCETEVAINQLAEELIDRFGLLPEPVKTLIASTHIACQARVMGIMKINASDTSINMQFTSKPSIDPNIIVQAIQTKKNYRLINAEKLQVKIAMPHIQDRILQVNNLLKELRGSADQAYLWS